MCLFIERLALHSLCACVCVCEHVCVPDVCRPPRVSCPPTYCVLMKTATLMNFLSVTGMTHAVNVNQDLY